MRGRLACALLCLVTLVTLPLVGAQNADAPDPTAALNVLYAASNSADNRDIGWMNTDPEDPANDQTSVGGSVHPLCDPVLGSVCVPQTEGIDWTWTWTLTPALRGPVQLSAGDLRIVAFLGAGTGSGSGIEVTTELKQGDAVIASGPMQEHSYEGVPTGETYQSVTWDVAVPATTLQAETPVVWTVRAVADTGETEGNFFMSVSEARGRSRVELPIGSALAAPRQLAGGPVTIRESIVNVTSDALLYGWNGTNATWLASYRAEGNGSVTFTIVDAANVTLLQQSVDGTGNGTKQLNGTAGNWTLAIRLDGFQGNVSLNLAQSTASIGSTTSTSGQDDGGDGAKDKGTPAAGLLAAMASLGLVLAVRRRRR